jgi:hypothetical protein
LLQPFQPPRTPKIKLKLNARQEQQQFMKAVTEAINSSKESDEQDIVGANVAMKLRKMTEEQRIYAGILSQTF